MRSSFPVSLLAFVPALAAAATTNTPQCLSSKANELAARSICGDKARLESCFKKTSDENPEDTIQKCLTAAGCTVQTAASEADYLYSFCSGEPVDLKRRERQVLAARDTTTTSETSTATSTSTSSTSTSTSTTSTDSTTTSSTTTDSTTTSGASKRDTTTAASTTDTAATTAGATVTTSLASYSGTACSTASVTSVSSCATTNTADCSLTASTTYVCASYMYCDTDTDGTNLCMPIQNGMTLSGTIVAVFLAVCVTSIIATVIFLCCRDRKEQKKVRARAEAAAIAKSNSVSRPETRGAGQNAAAAAQPNPFAG